MFFEVRNQSPDCKYNLCFNNYSFDFNLHNLFLDIRFLNKKNQTLSKLLCKNIRYYNILFVIIKYFKSYIDLLKARIMY